MTAGVAFTKDQVDEIKAEIVRNMANGDAVTFTQALQLVGKPSRAEAYQWRKEDPAFDRAVIEARWQSDLAITDLARSKAVEAVNKGDGKMVRFWLERKAKEQGFNQRIDTNVTTLRPDKMAPTDTQEAADAMAELLAASQTG